MSKNVVRVYGSTTGVLAMYLCTAAFEADRCMNITNSDE